MVLLTMILGGALDSASAQESDFWMPNLGGTTGLINIPTAEVLPSGTILFGVTVTEKKWAYFDRGDSDNWNYFFTVGFLPRVELSLRATYAPNDRLYLGAENTGTVDRGVGGRLKIVKEGDLIPALSVGIDDARGTRRFHALYAVGTKGISVGQAGSLRVTLGYGSDTMDAKNYVLNGAFGGGEFVLGDTFSLAVDHDTEKWNAAARLTLFHHLQATFVLLDFDIPSGGAAWFKRF